MMHEFAILPDVFERDVLTENGRFGVTVIELLRGLEPNGLLSMLDQGRWQTTVHQLLQHNAVAPALRDRVMACFAQLDNRKRLVRQGAMRNYPIADEFRWIRCAIDCDAECRMSGIFASDEFVELSAIDHDRLFGLSEALDSNPWQHFRRSQSQRLRQAENDYRAHLVPFLRYARKVWLIDRLLTPRLPRFQQIVEITAEHLRKRAASQKTGIVEIHAGDPMRGADDDVKETANDRLDEWESFLQPLVQRYGHEFRVYLWRRNGATDRVHDRYIFSDQCAISAPGGLDCSPGAVGSTTTLSVLKCDDRDEILKNFNIATSPFNPLGNRRFAR
jgi:hypothetical protein